MEDSQPNSKIFSVRIVSIDYYMSPPIPGLDLCYSSFQGGKVHEVPVIRVYGSTPAGQKTCMHIHRALPYLYVPCSDIVQQPEQEGDACVRVISVALEKALKLKGSAGSKRQHVHGCSLVRARKFYGYDASEQLYAKLYLYHPQDVSRAANLLLGGLVLEKSLQPHESHIPFLLQFLVDYNLQGMGHLHVSKMKFRHPVPHVLTKKKSNHYPQHKQNMDNKSSMPTNSQADASGDVCLESQSPICLSSTIPDTWIWHFSSQDSEVDFAKRQSVCELEGDAAIEDILNQQYKMYSSLSQTLSDVRMVQSLIPIWEEFERTGTHMETVSSDPAKPSPHDVLNTLSNKVEFENKLLELCSLENDVQSANKTGLMLSQCDYTREDLKLLNWLASSQAAEDINSDDELKTETILTPLMPATTIQQVLEKADMEFVTASQQECQDILDSVLDSTDCNSSSGKIDSSKKEICQIDGKRPIYPSGKTSNTDKNKEHKRKWSSLPFCSSENVNDAQQTDVKVGTENYAGSTIVGCSVRDLMRKKRNFRGESPKVEIHHEVKVTPDEELKKNKNKMVDFSGDQLDISPPTNTDITHRQIIKLTITDRSRMLN